MKLWYFGHMTEEPTHWKDPDDRIDWRQKGKSAVEDEMVGWHHRLNRYESEHTLGNSGGRGSLACCSPWGRKESDTSWWLSNNRCTWRTLSSLPHPLYCCVFSFHKCPKDEERLGWPVFWAEDIAYKEVPETRKSLGPSGTERKSMLLKDGKQKQQTSNQGGGQGPGYSEPCEKWEVWIFYLVLWETTEWFKVEERQVTLAALGKAE